MGLTTTSNQYISWSKFPILFLGLTDKFECYHSYIIYSGNIMLPFLDAEAIPLGLNNDNFN
jgi:hypothetical protein